MATESKRNATQAILDGLTDEQRATLGVTPETIGILPFTASENSPMLHAIHRWRVNRCRYVADNNLSLATITLESMANKTHTRADLSAVSDAEAMTSVYAAACAASDASILASFRKGKPKA